MGIPIPQPLVDILTGVHAVPVNRRIAEQHAKPVLARKRHVHQPYGSEELLVYRKSPLLYRLGRIQPHLTQRFIRNFFTLYEPIHKILVPGVAEFHHDVIDCTCKPGVANQRESKRVALLVPAKFLVAERHYGVRAKCFDNRRNRLDRDCKPRRCLLPGWRGGGCLRSHERSHGDRSSDDTQKVLHHRLLTYMFKSSFTVAAWTPR